MAVTSTTEALRALETLGCYETIPQGALAIQYTGSNADDIIAALQCHPAVTQTVLLGTGAIRVAISPIWGGPFCLDVNDWLVITPGLGQPGALSPAGFHKRYRPIQDGEPT